MTGFSEKIENAANPAMTLFRRIRLFLKTRTGLESMKEIPVL